jgi:hypothetical protein
MIGLYLFEKEPEWDAVHAAGVVLEVNDFDEVSLWSVDFILGHTFRDDIHVLIDTEDGITRHKLTKELMIMDLVYPYLFTFFLVPELGLLYERLDEILYVALLRHKYIKSFLTDVVSYAAKTTDILILNLPPS